MPRKKRAETVLYDMQYHDKWVVDDTLLVIRVIGGWIYVINWIDKNDKDHVTSQFVPVSQVK